MASPFACSRKAGKRRRASLQLAPELIDLAPDVASLSGNASACTTQALAEHHQRRDRIYNGGRRATDPDPAASNGPTGRLRFDGSGDVRQPSRAIPRLARALSSCVEQWLGRRLGADEIR